VTLKASLALGQNTKVKEYAMTINAMEVLKEFKNIGKVIEQKVLSPIADTVKTDLEQLLDKIKHPLVEIEALVQQIDDSDRTQEKLLQPIHDAYALIESFDEAFPKDPKAFQAKVLEAQQGVERDEDRVKKDVKRDLWERRWNSIQNQAAPVPAMQLDTDNAEIGVAIAGDAIAKCHHLCADDAGTSRCKHCMDENNAHAASTRCQTHIQDADADAESKVIAFNTCKRKINALLKDHKDEMSILSKCGGDWRDGACLVRGLADVCLGKDPVCKAQKVDFYVCKSRPKDACCQRLKSCTADITHDPTMVDHDNFAQAQDPRKRKEL